MEFVKQRSGVPIGQHGIKKVDYLMKTFTKQFLAVLLSWVTVYAQGNNFTKVRYNGGSVASKVDPKDWNNKLTNTPEVIVLE